MKIVLVFILFSLSGCAALNTNNLLNELRKSGCEIQSLQLKEKETTIKCHGFNAQMYQTERTEK